ncbi:conserved hypothetical protein [Neospora caninum Liverpool]|uniref:Uncharacterized protein n=1 Tax=Neospora caninum (strain Liverpool) TaxID=572307 RepID=F0VGK3_NEOCL|nr:conserved hypothetical protein [Neospora caninum Liverpool]CBZ52847.1 conserved hypothetical protein [Neospora caninum Liverpool]CEL66827.1 TPA: hypothetical protein BN1204_026360 [Neospora caninum Liverpool]|eukprot:XP_003882879.1 conserved hypothetical protein [Neospora caninum Liverpool]
MPMEDLARFRRKMEELTGLEFAEELRKRGVSVPGKEPQKIVDAVVRLLHDDLRAIEASAQDDPRGKRRPENEEEDDEPEFVRERGRGKGLRPLRGEVGEREQKRRTEEKKEAMLNLLQRMSPEEAAAAAQRFREMETRGESEQQSVSLERPRGETRAGISARAGAEDDAPGEPVVQAEGLHAGIGASQMPHNEQGEPPVEEDQAEVGEGGRGRDGSSGDASKRGDDVGDPSGIEPPEIRFFPEASTREYWEPRFAWRSEVASLEDQLELLQEKGLFEGRQRRQRPRRERSGTPQRRHMPGDAPRSGGAFAGENAARAQGEKDGQREREGEKRADEETEKGETHWQGGVQGDGAVEEEEDLDAWLGTGESEEDEGAFLTEADADRFPGLVTVRDLLRREILGLSLVTPSGAKKRTDGPRGKAGNVSARADAGTRLDMSRREDRDEAEGRERDTTRAWFRQRGRDEEEEEESEEDEEIDEDSGGAGDANVWKRKYKGTDEEDEDEDEDEDDEGDSSAQLILPSNFRSLPKDRREQLLRIHETPRQMQKEDQEDEQEQEDEGGEAETGPSEAVERRTYTQTERDEDMRRVAARLLSSSSVSPSSHSSSPSSFSSLGDKGDREGHRLGLPTGQSDGARGEEAGEGGDAGKGREEPRFSDRIEAYCVAWHQLVERQSGSGKGDEEIEEHEQRRTGVLLLPDASGWRDFFVRGLADRLADCCKCVVLVPDTQHIATRAEDFAPSQASFASPRASASVLRNELIHRCMRFLKREFALQAVALAGLEEGGGLALEGAADLFRIRREKRRLFATKAAVTAHDLQQILLHDALSSSPYLPASSPSSTYSPLSSAALPAAGSDLPSFLSGGELVLPDAVVAFYPRRFSPRFVGAHMEAPTLGIFADENGKMGKQPLSNGGESTSENAAGDGEGGDAFDARRREGVRAGRGGERLAGQSRQGEVPTPCGCREGEAAVREARERIGGSTPAREREMTDKIAQRGNAQTIEGRRGAETLEKAFREFDGKFQRDFMMHVFDGVSRGFAHRFWDEKTKTLVKSREAAEDAFLISTSWLDIWLSPPSEPPRFNVINDVTDFSETFKDFQPPRRG